MTNVSTPCSAQRGQRLLTDACEGEQWLEAALEKEYPKTLSLQAFGSVADYRTCEDHSQGCRSPQTILRKILCNVLQLDAGMEASSKVPVCCCSAEWRLHCEKTP